MGVVYLANHNVLKRPFAVKLLRREFVSNERALARFFREARVASSVDHPNIVSIYDQVSLNEQGDVAMAAVTSLGEALFVGRDRDLLGLPAVRRQTRHRRW